jgi:cell division protein FtsI/penicillin-binding protein 2
VRVALMKLPGIESADVSLDQASAEIRLKAGNAVSIVQLRELMKKNGFPTRDAQVVARGKIVDRDGKTVLDLLNGLSMDIVAAPQAAARLNEIRRDARQPVVDVTGVSRAIARNAEQLTISSFLAASTQAGPAPARFRTSGGERIVSVRRHQIGH